MFYFLPLSKQICLFSPSQKAYIFTFLLSSRLFIEPHALLSRVCHKCIEQQQLDDPVLDKVSTVDGREGMGRQVQRMDDAKVYWRYFTMHTFFFPPIPCCLCASIPLGGSVETEYLALWHSTVTSVP